MSAVTKHTPGPWCTYSVDPRIVIDARGASVCDCTPGNPLDIPYIQVMPNAKLIAAAPDLLAALIRLRDLDVNCTQAQDRDAWDQANAAIARASQ
jgi:hypothetical protein